MISTRVNPDEKATGIANKLFTTRTYSITPAGIDLPPIALPLIISDLQSTGAWA